MQTTINHGPMSQNRSETLVIKLYGDVRKCITPTVYKLHNTRHILTRTAIRLLRLAYDYTLNLLLAYIVAQKIKKRRRRNRHQPTCDNLQGVSDSYACTLLAVVNRQYTRHVFTFGYTTTMRQDTAHEARYGCLLHQP